MPHVLILSQIHPDAVALLDRAGCTTEQILAIGHTAAPEWRERIERLAALRYVKRILRSDFE